MREILRNTLKVIKRKHYAMLFPYTKCHTSEPGYQNTRVNLKFSCYQFIRLHSHLLNSFFVSMKTEPSLKKEIIK